MSGSPENTLWARAFVDELVRAGLREVVVAPGSRSTPLVMACAADGRVRIRVHLDERSAGFFALGVGKATGVPAAVVTTSGTAVANLYPAVIEASQSGVPLLVLSADRPHRLRGADANQAIDQVGIFAGYPRAFFEMPPPALDERGLRHVRTIAARAMDAAVGADAGPVHVNFPFDKPLEPEEAPLDFASAFPLAVRGRDGDVPLVRIEPARATLGPDRLDALAARLSGRSGVIVSGPAEDGGRTGRAARRFAARSGFALLADPLGGARFLTGDGDAPVAGYDVFLRDASIRAALVPEVVVRVGRSPTSASLQRWLFEHERVPQIVIDDGPSWKDHGGTAAEYLRADAASTLDGLSERLAAGSDGSGRAMWRRAHEAAAVELEGASAADLGEGWVAAAVLDAVPDGGTLVVSSSMPVRDLDSFAVASGRTVPVFANRGASGIDGVVSTAFGIASQAEGPTALVIGDVAFFHDANGLLWSREADAPLVIVIVDNDGGAIFGMLPIAQHDPDFTRYFTTPHGLDPSHAAAAHGLDYREVAVADVAASVREAFDGGGTRVLRVRTDGAEGHRLRAEVRDRVQRSVRAALG